MLESSVLSPDEIPQIILGRYDFSTVVLVSGLSGGSANLWKVVCDGTCYVLKEFQSKYSPADVRHEPKVVERLAQKGVPVPSFTCDSAGSFVWTFRERTFHLQSFMEGEVPARNRAPEWLVARSAELLADVNEGLDGLELPNTWPAEWFEFDPSRLEAQYSALLDRARRADVGSQDVLLADLDYRLRSVHTLAGLSLRPDLFTFRMSHGDYHTGQMLVLDGRVSAVLDFSAAGRMPVVWELLRSFTYACPACADGSIPVDRLVEYIGIYMERAPLRRSDLENMLALYYCQVLRSKYGYREFLQGIEEPEPMLEFAVWRTNLCRWLRENLMAATSELMRAFAPVCDEEGF